MIRAARLYIAVRFQNGVGVIEAARRRSVSAMKQILCVDDEVNILKTMKIALENHGYEVLATDDPSQAVRLVRERDIDLVTLDIRMPKISGFDIYKDLKKKKRPVPVLFVTAYTASFSTNSRDLVKMWKDEFSDGTTDILYKPFDIETLMEKVVSLVGPPSQDEA